MKLATAATTVLLIVVSLAHALRILLRVPLLVGSTAIPMWVSVGGTIVPAALAFGLWHEQGSSSRGARS